MNDHDRNNLQFILSLDEKSYDEWTASLTEDDIDYALELLKAARTEAMMHIAQLADDVEDSTEATTLLSKFTLKG
jgi:uncharacterized protein YihD (DUF1040 family)